MVQANTSPTNGHFTKSTGGSDSTNLFLQSITGQSHDQDTKLTAGEFIRLANNCKRLRSNPEQAAIDQEVVLIMGDTQVGKSTVGCLMMSPECELVHEAGKSHVRAPVQLMDSLPVRNREGITRGSLLTTVHKPLSLPEDIDFCIADTNCSSDKSPENCIVANLSLKRTIDRCKIVRAVVFVFDYQEMVLGVESTYRESCEMARETFSLFTEGNMASAIFVFNRAHSPHSEPTHELQSVLLKSLEVRRGSSKESPQYKLLDYIINHQSQIVLLGLDDSGQFRSTLIEKIRKTPRKGIKKSTLLNRPVAAYDTAVQALFKYLEGANTTCKLYIQQRIEVEKLDRIIESLKEEAEVLALSLEKSASDSKLYRAYANSLNIRIIKKGECIQRFTQISHQLDEDVKNIKRTLSEAGGAMNDASPVCETQSNVESKTEFATHAHSPQDDTTQAVNHDKSTHCETPPLGLSRPVSLSHKTNVQQEKKQFDYHRIQILKHEMQKIQTRIECYKAAIDAFTSDIEEFKFELKNPTINDVKHIIWCNKIMLNDINESIEEKQGNVRELFSRVLVRRISLEKERVLTVFRIVKETIEQLGSDLKLSNRVECSEFISVNLPEIKKLDFVAFIEKYATSETILYNESEDDDYIMREHDLIEPIGRYDNSFHSADDFIVRPRGNSRNDPDDIARSGNPQLPGQTGTRHFSHPFDPSAHESYPRLCPTLLGRNESKQQLQQEAFAQDIADETQLAYTEGEEIQPAYIADEEIQFVSTADEEIQPAYTAGQNQLETVYPLESTSDELVDFLRDKLAITPESFELLSGYIIGEEVDGDSFLELTENDLVIHCKMKIGPAKKIFRFISNTKSIINK